MSRLSKELGFKIEQRMMKFFKGQPCHCDEVDFETSMSLYEVKSCNLFNKTINMNHLRTFKNQPHKQIESKQLGKFQIITDNHIALYLKSIELQKAPKYIFVIRSQNQIIFKVVDWKDIKITNDKESHRIPINKIF